MLARSFRACFDEELRVSYFGLSDEEIHSKLATHLNFLFGNSSNDNGYNQYWHDTLQDDLERRFLAFKGNVT